MPLRIIAVTGAKGGTGKTTTALAVAYFFARADYRVALRDLDPQASATLALGQEPVPNPMQAAPVKVDGVSLYRGGRALAHEHGAPPAPKGVDVLVLDTPPALGPLTLWAIRAADLVLVPLSPTALDLPALADVGAVVDGIENPPKLRAVLTRADPRRALTADVAAHIEATRPGVLYPTRIPNDVKAAEAAGFGKAVTLHAPGSPSAKAYGALTVELFHDLT